MRCIAAKFPNRSLLWAIRADLARSIESRQVRSTSDTGHKVEPKRPPFGADIVVKVQNCPVIIFTP
jgi:hypothetical protein